jgi:hypothetical protein
LYPIDFDSLVSLAAGGAPLALSLAIWPNAKVVSSEAPSCFKYSLLHRFCTAVRGDSAQSDYFHPTQQIRNALKHPCCIPTNTLPPTTLKRAFRNPESVFVDCRMKRLQVFQCMYLLDRHRHLPNQLEFWGWTDDRSTESSPFLCSDNILQHQRLMGANGVMRASAERGRFKPGFPASSDRKF